MNDTSDLSAEYANIKAYCRKEAAKSYKDPRAPATEPEPKVEEAVEELSDAELEAMLGEET